MNESLFLKFKAVVTFIVTIGLIFFPAWMASLFGLEIDPGSVVFVQIIGGLYLSAALTLWYAGSENGIDARTSNFTGLGEVVQAIVMAIGAMNGTLNWVGWFMFAAYVFFAVGFFYFAHQKK